MTAPLSSGKFPLFLLRNIFDWVSQRVGGSLGAGLRPRLGGLSVSEIEDRREAVVRAGAKRSQETRRRREARTRRRGDE